MVMTYNQPLNGNYPVQQPGSGMIRYGGDGSIESLSLPSIMAGMLKREHSKGTASLFKQAMLPQGYHEFRLPRYGGMRAMDLAEGERPTEGQRLHPEFSSVSPKRIGLQIALTDEAMFYPQNTLQTIAFEAGYMAMGSKENYDAVATLALLYDAGGGPTFDLDFRNTTRLVGMAMVGRDWTETRPITQMPGQELVMISSYSALQRYSEDTTFPSVREGFIATIQSMPQWHFAQGFFSGKTVMGNVPLLFDNHIKASADGGTPIAVFRRDCIYTVRANMGTPPFESQRVPGAGAISVFLNDRYGQGIMDPIGGFQATVQGNLLGLQARS